MSTLAIVLEVSATLSGQDVLSLRRSIPEAFEVRELRPVQLGADIGTYLLVLRDFAEIAGGAAAIANLVLELVKWRNAEKERRQVGAVALKIEGQSRIDLSSATEAELNAALKNRLGHRR